MYVEDIIIYEIPVADAVYTTTAILSEKRKRMHSSGLQHTWHREYHYLVGSTGHDHVVDQYSVFAPTKSVIYATLGPCY